MSAAEPWAGALWRRYRRPFLWAVPLGGAVGVLFALLMYLTINLNPDFSRGGALAYFLLGGFLLGMAVAVAAAVGATVGVLIGDRRLQRSSGFRCTVGGWSAMFAVVIGLFCAGAWYSALIVILAIPIVLSGILAAVMIGRADRRAQRTPAPEGAPA